MNRDDKPPYPMPTVMRDIVEIELDGVPDRAVVSTVRRLIATAYAYGFHDGHLASQIAAHHDRAAAS